MHDYDLPPDDATVRRLKRVRELVGGAPVDIWCADCRFAVPLENWTKHVHWHARQHLNGVATAEDVDRWLRGAL